MAKKNKVDGISLAIVILNIAIVAVLITLVTLIYLYMTGKLEPADVANMDQPNEAASIVTTVITTDTVETEPAPKEETETTEETEAPEEETSETEESEESTTEAIEEDIYDEEFFRYIEQHIDGIKRHDDETLRHLIFRSCEIKAEVVGIDEKESGLRAILNYGHTFGHAIEKLTNYEMFSHGIAVSLGMRVAARAAVLLGMLDEAAEKRQNALLDALGFVKTFNVDKEKAWEAMAVDKKAEKGARVYILPTKIGEVKKVVNVDKDVIAKAWEAIR